jgi:hypothetical protein
VTRPLSFAVIAAPAALRQFVRQRVPARATVDAWSAGDRLWVLVRDDDAVNFFGVILDDDVSVAFFHSEADARRWIKRDARARRAA